MSVSIAKYVLPGCVMILFLSACSERQSVSRDAELIEEITTFQGRNSLDRTHITFNFRDKAFEVWRYDGAFRYSREFADDSLGTVLDVMDNAGVYRYVNGTLTPQTDFKRNSIETDVNSVVYFALLPYNLTDPAVISRYLGEGSIGGKSYEMLEITFQEEGGGRDYEDRFIYWIDADGKTIDYMSYFYHTDDGGSRFRKAVDRRRVGGILFADYLNYAAMPDTIGSSVELFGQLFDQGAVNLVSEIRLDSLRVETPDSIPRFP